MIDGIAIALDHVTKMIETVYSIININVFAIHINDIATVDSIGDTSMEILQGLSDNYNIS